MPTLAIRRKKSHPYFNRYWRTKPISSSAAATFLVGQRRVGRPGADFSHASHPRWPIRLPACMIPWADFSRSGASFYCNSLTRPLGSRSSSKQLCVDEKPCECGKSRSCFGIARGGCPRCHSLRRCALRSLGSERLGGG